MAIKIGILGAGKVGIAIAALLDIMRFVDSVILADIRSSENLDGLRKARFRKLDVLSEPDLANFVSHCDAIVSAALEMTVPGVNPAPVGASDCRTSNPSS